MFNPCNIKAHLVGSAFRQPIIMSVRPSVFDGHVAALKMTGFAQSFAECLHEMCIRLGRTGAEEPDHRDRLLRAPPAATPPPRRRAAL
jgi:hypothetical protein